MERTIELYDTTFETIPVRVVDNEKFTDAWFAPSSVYARWKESVGGTPSADDWFYGYVEDGEFWTLSDAEFEEHVCKYFD